MKLTTTLIAATLVLVTTPAFAEDKPANTTAPAAKKEDPGDRIVCRTEEEIGSRLRKKKTCLTVAQWRELSARSGMKTDEMTSRTSINGN